MEEKCKQKKLTDKTIKYTPQDEQNIIIYLHSYYIASVPPFMHSLILISIIIFIPDENIIALDPSAFGKIFVSPNPRDWLKCAQFKVI